MNNESTIEINRSTDRIAYHCCLENSHTRINDEYSEQGALPTTQCFVIAIIITAVVVFFDRKLLMMNYNASSYQWKRKSNNTSMYAMNGYDH